MTAKRRTPCLLLLLVAAALAGHLWMLHGTAEPDGMGSSASPSSALLPAAVTAPPGLDSDTHVMALSCLAVLGVCAAFVAATRALVRPAVRVSAADGAAPIVVWRSLRPPPSPGAQRLRAGTVLLV